MARLVKKGTKGAVGGVQTPGPAAAPVEGIAEIDFSGAAAAPETKAKSKYPLIEGSKVGKVVDRVIELGDKFDAVADPFKAAKLELIEMGFPEYFLKNKGRVEAPSSMLAYGSKGGVRVTFKDKFTPGDRARLEALLTPAVAAKWFRQHWVIKIDGGEIPASVGPALVTELKAVMAKHGASHAMEIKAAILPNPDFLSKRHFEFDNATNLAINDIVPQQAAVSTKGVK
jgi:hypothetical protein